MRKLKLQVQMSIDGYIADENGELDWMTFDWSNDLNEYITQLTNPVDTILLGRKLAQGFIPYWTEAFNKPVPVEGAKKMVETLKIVFTKTLNESDPNVIGWYNTVLAKGGHLVEEINTIKEQDGKDIIVYGGGTFVSALIKEGLIDEFNLLVNPVAIGNGMTIFKELNNKQNLVLKKVQQFDCGIALLCYERKGD